MIVKPKIRGFICTTAHPEGCKARVKSEIDYIKSQNKVDGPKKVLIIGASTGYGLSSRIAAAFGSDASTLGVVFEKAAHKNRTASAGWYNTAALEEFANEDGLYAKTINGDAFSNEIKQETCDLIKKDLGQIDCLIYSLASPRRTDPDTGVVYNSVLKTIQGTYSNKTVNPLEATMSEVTLGPAEEDEINNTIAVMGGDDWQRWINLLKEQNLLSDNFQTLAYSYVGPELTYPMYREGTIGRAKDHLENTANELNKVIGNGRAAVAVNKAVVTQSSAAIPVVPLYVSILFKIMKDNKTHEGCIEQMYRLFKDYISQSEWKLDQNNRIRIDDLEMLPETQEKVVKLWDTLNDDNLSSLTDLSGYQDDFFQLFGFRVPGVDYENDVDVDVKISSITD